MIDYHTHHERCGHASGAMIAYVEQACASGLDEIGLSDHSPIYHLGPDPHPRPQTAMSQVELPHYVAEMVRIKEAFTGRIQVRMGVESDYVLGWDEHYRRLWAQYPLDYVIGSVHWLDAWSIFSDRLPAGRSVADVYEEYWRTTQRAAQSGAFDVLGHLDCIKTRGYVPARPDPALVDQTVRVIAECGVCIELNTSGWRKSCAEQYPSIPVLERCLRYGVPVTVGSDAHAPHLVAADIDRALRLLREIGFTHVATFSGRQRHLLPL